MLLTNLTIARFQRKIRKCWLARSQSVTYVLRCVYKKKKKKKSHTINYYGKSGDFRTPDPRQGLYTRNCNGRNYSFYHSWRPSWRPLFAENSRASGGSAPWTPPVWGARWYFREIATGETLQFLSLLTTILKAPYLLKTRELAGAPPPGPHPYEARTDISRPPPFFANPESATVHIPPCSSKSLAPPCRGMPGTPLVRTNWLLTGEMVGHEMLSCFI